MICKVLKIHRDDNVAVAVDKIHVGENILVEGKKLTASNDILPGHKLALTCICSGEYVIKYGFPIGRASSDINNGDLVHSGNLATGLDGTVEYVYTPKLTTHPSPAKSSFKGYVRTDGEVGIRNEIGECHKDCR